MVGPSSRSAVGVAAREEALMERYGCDARLMDVRASLVQGSPSYSRCSHYEDRGDRALCHDPGRPWIGCRRPNECCWDCEYLADCEHACPDAADSAAREMRRAR